MAGQMGLIYEDDKRYSKLLDKIDEVDSLNKRTTQSSQDFTQSLLGELSPQSHYGTANRGTAYSIIENPGNRDYSYSIYNTDELADFDPMGKVPATSCTGKACAKIKRGLKKIAKTLKRKKSRKKKSNSSDEEINPNDLYNLGGGVKTRKKQSGGHHLYKRLGVSKYASQKQIRKAFKTLKKKRKLNKKVKEAFKILSIKKTRKEYNNRYKKAMKKRKRRRKKSRKRKSFRK